MMKITKATINILIFASKKKTQTIVIKTHKQLSYQPYPHAKNYVLVMQNYPAH
jgi:hypothetical protein